MLQNEFWMKKKKENKVRNKKKMKIWTLNILNFDKKKKSDFLLYHYGLTQ